MTGATKHRTASPLVDLCNVTAKRSSQGRGVEDDDDFCVRIGNSISSFFSGSPPQSERGQSAQSIPTATAHATEAGNGHTNVVGRTDDGEEKWPLELGNEALAASRAAMGAAVVPADWSDMSCEQADREIDAWAEHIGTSIQHYFVHLDKRQQVELAVGEQEQDWAASMGASLSQFFSVLDEDLDPSLLSASSTTQSSGSAAVSVLPLSSSHSPSVLQSPPPLADAASVSSTSSSKSPPAEPVAGREEKEPGIGNEATHGMVGDPKLAASRAISVPNMDGLGSHTIVEEWNEDWVGSMAMSLSSHFSCLDAPLTSSSSPPSSPPSSSSSAASPAPVALSPSSPALISSAHCEHAEMHLQAKDEYFDAVDDGDEDNDDDDDSDDDDGDDVGEREDFAAAEAVARAIAERRTQTADPLGQMLLQVEGDRLRKLDGEQS